MENTKKPKRKRRTTKKPVKKENLEESHKNYKIYNNQEYPKLDEQFTDNLFPPDENSLIGQDTTGKYPVGIELQKKK